MTSPLQNVATRRMIFLSNGEVWSIRTRAIVGEATGLRTLTRRASTFFLLRLAIEATQALKPLASRFSLGEGHRRLICNLRGGFKALRSLLSFPLIPLRQEPTSGRFQSFEVSKVLSSLAAHVHNMKQGVSENAEIASGEVQNVVR